MGKILFSCKGDKMRFYSHPDKLLIDHLVEVRDINLYKVSERLRRPFEIVALCHDFGKYTSFFQKYLFNNIKKSDLGNHGFISAVFGAFVGFKEFGEDSILPLIIYNVILHHHGNVKSFSENLPTKIKNIKKTDYSIELLNKLEIGEKQLEDINKNMEYLIDDFEQIELNRNLKDFLNEEGVIGNVLQKLRRLDFKLSMTSNNEKDYFIHQSIYSALISADKISASGIEYDAPLFCDYEEIRKIKMNKFKGSNKPINKIRDDIFESVLNNLEHNYNKGKIFSITAPTGTGKTYTGFYTAARLKELLGLTGNIIYSLPFTSIIDQNYKSLIDILQSVESFSSNPNRYIIKHHNLSKADYVTDYHDYSKLQSELLIENWESGIIVTTFVQIFETLAGNRNRMLKKFIKFYDSVVLIDELQSIDIRYYKLVEFVLKKLCEYTNCRIIIMTATKPMILEDSIELLPNSKEYFEMFNRTRLIPKLYKVSISEFIENFIESFEDKSYMIVCNTINQSIEIYNSLRYLDKDIYYLSTNILQFKRKEVIQEISKRLKNKDNIILVSTQVVEAGVDLDFDEVIRDLAPLDSIIQCSGRCNRNYSQNQGYVKIVNMVNENGESYGKYIYGDTQLNITRKLLKDFEYINEENYFELINEYYNEVNDNKSRQDSDEFIKAIKEINFSNGDWAINKFSLIKENSSYVNVLFLHDEFVENIYEEYKDILIIKNFIEKKEKYLEIGQVLKNYTLSIPIKYCRNFVQENGLLVLPREGIEQYYNEETGFIRNNSDTYMIF